MAPNTRKTTKASTAKSKHQESAKPAKKTAAAATPRAASTTNSAPATPSRTDMILPLRDPYMQQIISGAKTHEFRRYDMPGVERIWFYRSAPHSALTHVCEVSPAGTRNAGDAPLPEDGLGNREYNERDPEWEGYDFAFRIDSVYEIDAPGGRGIKLAEMKGEFGMKAAPQSRCRVPVGILERYRWDEQTKIR